MVQQENGMWCLFHRVSPKMALYAMLSCFFNLKYRRMLA